MADRRGPAHMPQSPFGTSLRNNRPDISAPSSGSQTPLDESQQRKAPPKPPKKYHQHQHRESSLSNIDHGDAFTTPDRTPSQPFDIPLSGRRIVPTLSIDGNANPNLMPTPHQAYPRAMSDGSLNHGALDSSSQSGYDTPTAETSSLSQVSTAADRPRIIYRLALNDYKEGPINGTTFRYSFKPFEGLNRSDDPNRHSLAVMDLSSNVLGYWPHGGPRRKNQLRDSFWRDDEKTPFIVGVDFISRSHTYYSIRIHSKPVLDCLRSLIKYYPDLGLALEQPEVSFEYPYRALVHYYAELQKLRDECKPGVPQSSTLYNSYTREDLDVVLGYMETIYMSEIKPELDLHRQDPPVAKFDALWLLFKPGDTVFARIKGQLMFFKVLSANRDIDKAGDPTGPWSVVVWGLYFDGYLLRRQARKFKIHEYHGQRDIQKLPIKPISFLEDSDQKLADRLKGLTDRGKQYWSFICQAPLYRRYNGPVNGDNGEQYIGDVIVDPTAYIKEHTKSKALPGVFEVMFGAQDQQDLGEVRLGDPPDYGGGPYSRLNDRICSKDAPPLEESDDYLLLPGYIQGYALRGKNWMAFDLDSFEPRETTDKPWKSLVINKDEFELVQSLAYSIKDHHGTELSPWASDFIAGKGQGQVVLLHGPSGVGKTMTVECIATQMGRPLLCLTVADIGTKETEAELNLSKWLAHASKWGAVVLIDEAETFLTKRGEGDLARNAIVAAFLRTLEYHQGMIFLTTNEPGHIDDAIISRLHLAIQYNPLTKKQRSIIWRNMMNQLLKEQKELPATVQKTDILPATMTEVCQETMFTKGELDKLEVSGRDIRNAFQAAVRLARYEASKDIGANGDKMGPIQVEAEHFHRAFQSKLDLKKSIDSIENRTQSQRANDKGLRTLQKVEKDV